MQGQKLNALQLELLNVYSFEPKEEDLLAIKKMLALYFSDKLQANVQKGIKEKGIEGIIVRLLVSRGRYNIINRAPIYILEGLLPSLLYKEKGVL